jgi:hypothetical protein
MGDTMSRYEFDMVWTLMSAGSLACWGLAAVVAMQVLFPAKRQMAHWKGVVATFCLIVFVVGLVGLIVYLLRGFPYSEVGARSVPGIKVHVLIAMILVGFILPIIAIGLMRTKNLGEAAARHPAP